jgi:hypothetical protein
MWEANKEQDVPTQAPVETETHNDEADDDDDFGDDFDDFAEGGGDDDDFGDFDHEPATPGEVVGSTVEKPLSYSLPEQLAELVSSHQIYLSLPSHCLHC